MLFKRLKSKKNKVLEKNPPKQGLKHEQILEVPMQEKSFREKSTKTRIETTPLRFLFAVAQLF